MFPHFLGIGAQKAGTTWLHKMLSMHDEIWLPPLKELHYFDRKFPAQEVGSAPISKPQQRIIAAHILTRLRRINPAKLREHLRVRKWPDLVWEIRFLTGDWSDEWYATLFESAGERLAGEITPAYSCLSERAIFHIHSLMPAAKLILLLRDPIERAWSHANMDLTHPTKRNARMVSGSEYKAHFNGSASRLRGDYLGIIRRWLTHFPEDQLYIGFFDEIASSPDNLLTSIFQFLGVSATASHIPHTIRTRINAGVHEKTIPSQLHQYLSTLYVRDLRELASQYESYPRLWLENCEMVLSSASSAS
jgi:hypothetical protein